MELGPIQKEWVAYLRANPDKQTKNFLGILQEDGTWKMCCLGALIMLGYEQSDTSPRTINRTGFRHEKDTYLCESYSNSDSYKTILYSRDQYGLKDSVGGFSENNRTVPISVGKRAYNSLAAMNDDGVSWLQIADVIEQNAHLIFNTSI